MTLIRLWSTDVIALLFGVAVTVNAAEPVLPIECPVVLLPGTPATAPAITATMRPLPAPTTPSGRLPQYELGPSQLAKVPQQDPKDAAIRFGVTMPQGPLLVEIAVTIDGQPYLTQRNRRLTRLLEHQAAEALQTAVSAVAAITSPQPEATDRDHDLISRLQRYRMATGRALTLDEINWWLATAVEGPPVLWLKDNFQRFRAHQRPVMLVLDRNRDGTVDAEELARAEESLLATDANRNDIVEFTEIGQAARSLHQAVSSGALPQLSRVDHPHDSASPPPDMLLTVDFKPSQPGESGLRLVSLSDGFASRVSQMHAAVGGIALHIDGHPVMLEAVQVTGVVSDQISLGSVNDGYPWLPALDRNDDGRLTVRERRQLHQQLATFDTNHDGSLTAEESVAPFRVAIGLGPTVHRHLANIRSHHPRSATPPDAGPEWFTRMDRNKDHDLTRAEFPGTDEQFRAMDRDDDQLIDIAEARIYDESQPKSDPTEPAATPKP